MLQVGGEGCGYCGDCGGGFVGDALKKIMLTIANDNGILSVEPEKLFDKRKRTRKIGAISKPFLRGLNANVQGASLKALRPTYRGFSAPESRLPEKHPRLRFATRNDKEPRHAYGINHDSNQSNIPLTAVTLIHRGQRRTLPEDRLMVDFPNYLDLEDTIRHVNVLSSLMYEVLEDAGSDRMVWLIAQLKEESKKLYDQFHGNFKDEPLEDAG